MRFFIPSHLYAFICLLAFAPGLAQASENLFLKGNAGKKEVMVRLSIIDPDDNVPKVLGGSRTDSDIYQGAYYEIGGNGVETFLVGRVSPKDKKTLTIHSVIDGKVSSPLWTFAFKKKHSQQEEWKGSTHSADGYSGKIALNLWLTDWNDAPEDNEEYNAPRLDVSFKAGPETLLENGLAYAMMTDPLAGTIYPRLIRHPDSDVIDEVNSLMDYLQRNLMKSHLQCLSNGRSTPGTVENRTKMTLLTNALLSASMHYKYSDGNPDMECSQYFFPDPLNVALLSSNMDAGEILGLEDMFTEKVIKARALQQYAWRTFSKQHPDQAEDCRKDFSSADDDISLHFTEAGAVFEMSLDEARAACAVPVEIAGNFLSRLVKSGSPLEDLWQTQP